MKTTDWLAISLGLVILGVCIVVWNPQQDTRLDAVEDELRSNNYWDSLSDELVCDNERACVHMMQYLGFGPDTVLATTTRGEI